MNKNIFFKKIKKISVNEICKKLKIKNITSKKIYLNDIKTLDAASRNDLTFLHSSKYLKLIPKIKSNFIITSSKFQKYLKYSQRNNLSKKVMRLVLQHSMFLDLFFVQQTR